MYSSFVLSITFSFSIDKELTIRINEINPTINDECLTASKVKKCSLFLVVDCLVAVVKKDVQSRDRTWDLLCVRQIC